ncbi:hypothetical protein [Gordonia sp. ABSL49_1]|uniref:hypothetical protein n=1 Tax=Gordonia sp. ABSL49_1 TaxID=2920941 RepID=UPI0035AEF435
MQRWPTAHLARVFVILLVGMLIGSPLIAPQLSPRAGAAPGDPPPPMSLRDVGSSSTITFVGQQGAVSLSLPVPENLTPSEIRGTAQLPAFVTGGSVDVMQGDRLLSRNPIPSTPNAPITLSLRGVRVDRHAADIVLRSYLRADGFCQFDPANAFRIVNSTLTYTGRERRPTAVADFLPPVLRKLTIYVPDDVQQAEGAAAVNLATAVVANYGSAPVAVETRSLPRNNLVPTTPVGPLERQVVISTSAPAGLSLRDGPGWPFLQIGGPAQDLLVQVQFLGSDLSSIAMSSSAVAGPLRNAPQLAPQVQTLADLGVGDQLVTSSAWPTVSFGIDQTRLGRPSHNVRVQLVGSYSYGGDSAGQLSVRVGNRVIDSWAAGSSGAYNRWVDIPDGVLSRFTQVVVAYTRSGVPEACGNGTRGSLSLDSSGEVTSDAADPPVPAGFQSLPQSLMPRTQLAWTKGDVGDVARAVAIMTGMQRMSAIPLGVDVVSISDATGAQSPAILIAADGQGLPDLDLPVTSDGSTITVTNTAGQTSQVTLTPATRYGTLQVARDDDRTVLVATSTEDTADLDAILAWLGDDPDRWAAMSGDAVLQVADREPVFVTVDDAVPPSESSDSGLSKTAAAAVAVGALCAAGAVAAIIVVGRRRRGRQG